MGKVVDLQSVRDEKEHGRKEAKLEKVKSALESSRQANESKSKSAQKLKKLFKKSSLKSSSPKPTNKKK